GFVRTQSFVAPEEREAADRVVHIAITWDANGRITAYRDGQPYGQAYTSGPPVTYQAGAAQVLFGLRHSPPGGHRHLSARIHAAHLYDRALSAEDVAASAQSGPTGVSLAELLAELTPD